MTPSCRPCGHLQRIPWSRRGAVLVEFALILPLFMLLLIGTLEFARAFEVWQVVVNSAREGARTVALPPGPQSNTDLVVARIEDYFTSNGLDLAALHEPEIVNIDGQPGSIGEVTVRYDYTFDFFGGIVSLFAGDDPGTITLSSTSKMRNE